MQVAEILSDLASLRACDHEAALDLVTSHKRLPAPADTNHSSRAASGQAGNSNKEGATERGAAKGVQEGSGGERDPDLQRALDLMDLHYGVRERWAQGTDMRLEQARRAVEEVLAGLDAEKGQRKRG